ncbi:MAG: hypothetical protein ACR2G4_06760 [Pyrinomonadaceae bacterium]
MSTEDEDIPPFEEELSVPPAPRAFAPAEMVACEACLRANPPTRMNCLYCGADLPVVDASNDLRRPTLRALEVWEQGYNVVMLPQAIEQISADAITTAVQLLHVEAGQLRGMAEAQTPLPLARAASRDEASLVERKLRVAGWQVEIVADQDLAVETHAPKRIRKLKIGDDALTGWTSAEGAAERVEWTRVELLVTGHIARKRIEVEERRSRRAENEIVETREFHDDESVLDLYLNASVVNWRIMAENFDYSCLGAEKKLLATENFKHLVETFRTQAARAAYDDSYRSVRHYLKFAWPLAEQTQAGNLKRLGPGRYNSEAVTSVTNERQFTRYGRLLHYFRSRQRPHAT